MAVQAVAQNPFGDDTGPVQVLLVFKDTVSAEDVDALEHNFPFTVDPLQNNNDDMDIFLNCFEDNLRNVFGVNTTVNNMLVAEFANYQALRAEGSGFLMRLVTNGTLVAAYRMNPSDIKELKELDRQLNEAQIIEGLCDEFRHKLSEHLIRKANNPSNYIRNHAQIEEEFGTFDYEMAKETVALDIDSSKTLSYVGPCNELVAALNSAPKQEIAEHLAKMRACIQSLKL